MGTITVSIIIVIFLSFFTGGLFNSAIQPVNEEVFNHTIEHLEYKQKTIENRK